MWQGANSNEGPPHLAARALVNLIYAQFRKQANSHPSHPAHLLSSDVHCIWQRPSIDSNRIGSVRFWSGLAGRSKIGDLGSSSHCCGNLRRHFSCLHVIEGINYRRSLRVVCLLMASSLRFSLPQEAFNLCVNRNYF